MERFMAAGLERTDFTFSEPLTVFSGVVATYEIVHQPTGSKFRLNGMPTANTEWHGTMQVAHEKTTTWSTPNWAQVPAMAGKWAGEVSVWERTPDLWDLDSDVSGILSDTAENTPFTPEEQAEIAERLDDVQAYIRESPDLEDEHLAAIGEKLDYLKDATRRVGRKDWLLMLSGTGLAMVLNDAIPRGVAETIVSLAVHAVGHLFGAGTPPVLPA